MSESEKIISSTERISPEQRDAFLAFEQLCNNRFEQRAEVTTPLVADSHGLGLTSAATGGDLSVYKGYGRSKYRYEVIRWGYKTEEQPYAVVYTLTNDSILRRRDDMTESDFQRHSSLAEGLDDMTDSERFGMPLLADETFSLVDELARAQWNRTTSV